ncbi:MAG: asparagine synthase (glutamine-hydrolyzing) [Gemmatimonadota bacterium]
MCGIAGFIGLRGEQVPFGADRLALMNEIQAHRGPDGEGTWLGTPAPVGLAHRRLSIIDAEQGAQPMRDPATGVVLIFNGEIYNFRELRDQLGRVGFRTGSDTEVLLRAYLAWGEACLDRLRGMFSFALWDPRSDLLFCARDRFGIKPFYHAEADGVFYFASEAKALLPFLPKVDTDVDGLRDYLTFQFCLKGRTLFEGVRELAPGHALTVQHGTVRVRRYWQVWFAPDVSRRPAWMEERLAELIDEAVAMHTRADVPVGAYVSGGLDSSLVATLAARHTGEMTAFTGRFDEGAAFDESHHARAVAEHAGMTLHERTITSRDFVDQIERVAWHLDYPVAGPGAFSQFMVAELASQHRKVVLGGQGGDEIFGGYARYLIAYFEQCIKAAIDGTMQDGRFVVTYESIIPNLTALQQYKPLLQQFWKDGLFAPMDQRYFRLVNRALDLGDTVRWDRLGDATAFDAFADVFHGENVGRQSYFDLMTHFDSKTLLPALLHVEDRMSMAHGVESRVPLLDTSVVEFAATMPADVKFAGGELKRVLRRVAAPVLPASVMARTDKMGFPTPLAEWSRGPAREFVLDILGSQAASTRPYIDNRRARMLVESEPRFGRSLWAVLSLELWHRQFHDVQRAFTGAAPLAIAA